MLIGAYYEDSDTVRNKIFRSSYAVYNNIHEVTLEDEFKAADYSLKWCKCSDFDYNEVKRQAESCAATYNSYPASATLNTSKAEKIGFEFTKVHDRIYKTIDNYVKLLS